MTGHSLDDFVLLLSTFNDDTYRVLLLQRHAYDAAGDDQTFVNNNVDRIFKGRNPDTLIACYVIPEREQWEALLLELDAPSSDSHPPMPT